jgi:Rps23 Pro-64 3,4-dihydroxylase Tpa1-like proline 4-hydroxylase
LEALIAAADIVSLVSTVVAEQSRFVEVQVIAPSAAPGSFETGQSRVLTEVGDLASKFGERIQQILPQALEKLRVPSFRISRVDAQVTATNDQESLRFRGARPGAQLTFVFMFHKEPQGFAGGDLRIYDANMIHGQWLPASTYRTLPVRQNMLVLFPSRFSHQILPVHCPSRSFENSLFTVTGWLYE